MLDSGLGEPTGKGMAASFRSIGARSRLCALSAVIVAAALGYWLSATPAGPPTLRRFNPERVADLELRMWQAYYANDRMLLFALLVTMLHEQNHYSWATAAREGFYLARAAVTFGNARSDYETVLPDLERAYGLARTALHAGFDPHAVARAELSWWVARRTPSEDSPDHVGSLMADAYARLYNAPRSLMVKAATLRAQAAALRDAHADQPDWATIGRLLQASYDDLRTALSNGGD